MNHNNANTRKFLELIQKLKDEHFVTNVAVARKLGLNKATIANYKKGLSSVKDGILEKLLTVYSEELNLTSQDGVPHKTKEDLLREEVSLLSEQVNTKLDDLQNKYEEMVKNNSRLLAVIEKLMNEDRS